MVKKVEGQAYTCKHGKVFATLNEALECDLQRIFENAINESKTFRPWTQLHVESLKKDNEMPDMIANLVLAQQIRFECDAVTHWVINNSHALEEMITFVLDTRNQFEKEKS